MMETNDLIQWLTVSVIILIVLIAIVRKVNKLRRNIKDGDASGCGCGCGCEGCTKHCESREQSSDANHERADK